MKAKFMVKFKMRFCGSSSVVERQLPKLNVAGSNPVSRSKIHSAWMLRIEYSCGLFVLSCFLWLFFKRSLCMPRIMIL
jgi:hypothetical protein